MQGLVSKRNDSRPTTQGENMNGLPALPANVAYICKEAARNLLCTSRERRRPVHVFPLYGRAPDGTKGTAMQNFNQPDRGPEEAVGQ